MRRPVHVSFAFGSSGEWIVDSIRSVVGAGLPSASRLSIHEGLDCDVGDADWWLRGVTSHAHYATRKELHLLAARQEGLGRAEATRAALIPIRKTEIWWTLGQDQRRAIMEDQSRHISLGLEHLPDVARRVHHCRELAEPFDFLTWFEYPSSYSDRFEELVRILRRTPEWRHVDREIDIRLTRA